MTAPSNIGKYFIAIVPPAPVYERAWRWKEFFKANFNSKAALNSPPHITLHMPFEWKLSKESFLIEKLRGFATSQPPFNLQLKNFNCFAPRVIYINIVENKELVVLQSVLTQYCKSTLNLFNANRLDLPFHPHLTVAFRDLKKSVFPAAWAAVAEESFEADFRVNHIALLKHDGKIWHILTEFPLGTFHDS